MKKEAISMKKCIMTGDFKGIINSLKSGWESKKRSATTVTNKLVEDIHDEAIKSGALAGRLSGAGGGGFMLFYVPAQKRVRVINALKNLMAIHVTAILLFMELSLGEFLKIEKDEKNK